MSREPESEIILRSFKLERNFLDESNFTGDITVKQGQHFLSLKLNTDECAAILLDIYTKLEEMIKLKINTIGQQEVIILFPNEDIPHPDL